MGKKLMLAAMLLPLATISCSAPAPVANLCAEIHPIHGLSIAAVNALSDEKALELDHQNCKIEQACGYPLDSNCQKP